MDNLSVIVRLVQLVVFGLFLITCPAEGYVAGWTDSSDWSVQGLQSSPWKRQNELTMTEPAKKYVEIDGELLYTSGDNTDPPPQQPIYNKNAASANRVSIDDHNDETSTNAVTEGEVRNSEDEKIADGSTEKDVKLTNGPQDNENDINSADDNNDALLILPISSRL